MTSDSNSLQVAAILLEDSKIGECQCANLVVEIKLWCACAARVTVLGLCVCLHLFSHYRHQIGS